MAFVINAEQQVIENAEFRNIRLYPEMVTLLTGSLAADIIDATTFKNDVDNGTLFDNDATTVVKLQTTEVGGWPQEGESTNYLVDSGVGFMVDLGKPYLLGKIQYQGPTAITFDTTGYDIWVLDENVDLANGVTSSLAPLSAYNQGVVDESTSFGQPVRRVNDPQALSLPSTSGAPDYSKFLTGPGEVSSTDSENNYPGTISFKETADDLEAKRYRYIVVLFRKAYNPNILLLGGFAVWGIGNRIARNYGIEFDDALLSLQSWNNVRYGGSKLISKEINQYNGPFATPITFADGVVPNLGEYKENLRGLNAWGGDISYGLNPVISNEICAVYIGSTLENGDQNTNLSSIDGHSYLNIDKILLINVVTDEVQVIDRVNMDNLAFKRHVQSDFPEGSTANFKLLDRSIMTNIKQEYKVKFNEGNLMRIYTYTPNTGGFDDGVFGGFGVRGDDSHESTYLGINQYATNEQQMKGNLVDNYGSESLDSATFIEATGSYVSSSHCGGLFSFGMTACASKSLFNNDPTSGSISFVTQLPDELITYVGDVDTSTLGESLNGPCTASYSTGLFEVAPENK